MFELPFQLFYLVYKTIQFGLLLKLLLFDLNSNQS